MSFSRCLFALAPRIKSTTKLFSNKQTLISQPPKRWSSEGTHFYRTLDPEVDPALLKRAEFYATMTWWWILWNVIDLNTEYVCSIHPDPSKWTDEELGIPPE